MKKNEEKLQSYIDMIGYTSFVEYYGKFANPFIEEIMLLEHGYTPNSIDLKIKGGLQICLLKKQKEVITRAIESKDISKNKALLAKAKRILEFLEKNEK